MLRMLELRGKRDLAAETLGTQRLGQIRIQHLERDLTLMLAVFGQEDRCHAAVADLAVHLVLRSKRLPEAFQDVNRCHALSGVAV